MAENESENSSREDLSEEPSQRKIDEYREKGIVVQSRELTALCALMATAVVFSIRLPDFIQLLSTWMEELFRVDVSMKVDLLAPDVLGIYGARFLKICFFIGLPVSFSGLLIGVLGSYFQIGSIFSFDPLMPDWKKINPIQGIKKFFSFQYLIESMRILLKSAFFFTIAAFSIFSFAQFSTHYIHAEISHLAIYYFKSIENIFFILSGVLFLFSGFDFLIQKWNHSKNIRVTKSEAKQEHKEREGDPQIKSRVRSIQREVSKRRMMKAVKTADVIVTNPTHLAIALSYKKEAMSAPRVVAKGADFIAQKMKQVALEASIPLVENVPLARALYKTVKIGHTIPKSLYQAVAEVLAYVYKLKRNHF